MFLFLLLAGRTQKQFQPEFNFETNMHALGAAVSPKKMPTLFHKTSLGRECDLALIRTSLVDLRSSRRRVMNSVQTGVALLSDVHSISVQSMEVDVLPFEHRPGEMLHNNGCGRLLRLRHVLLLAGYTIGTLSSGPTQSGTAKDTTGTSASARAAPVLHTRRSVRAKAPRRRAGPHGIKKLMAGRRRTERWIRGPCAAACYVPHSVACASTSPKVPHHPRVTPLFGRALATRACEYAPPPTCHAKRAVKLPGSRVYYCTRACTSISLYFILPPKLKIVSQK